MSEVSREYSIGAAILVGGRSTRMGRPKESVIIEQDGRTFLERICDEVDRCEGICIRSKYLSVRKGQPVKRDGYRTVEDRYDDIGPLGGLISVLEAAKEDGCDAVLILACDMIRYMGREIADICMAYNGEEILWARTEGKDIQPLASIYSVALLDRACQNAKTGCFKLKALTQNGIKTAFFDSKDPSFYDNVNSEKDLQAQNLAREGEKMPTEYRDTKFTQERALFGSRDIILDGCVFEEGESPLKESSDITARECLFRYKYPFWYCEGVNLDRVTFFEMARAGVWYTKHFSMKNAIVEAPKNFRRCDDITLENVVIPNAAETLWQCNDLKLRSVRARGDYFAMNCSNVKITDLDLVGNYSFDGVVNMEISDSHLASKDAFWNTENVTVKSCFVTGEYLGWNSKNLTLVDCTIESLQGMCYIDNLVMKNCRLINTTLAFEYSDVDADITGGIESVFNPGSGQIKAERIGHLVIQKDYIDPSRTRIICDVIDETTDTPEGLW